MNAVEQELESITPSSRVVDVVRIPAPYGKEHFRVEIESGVKGRRVVKAKIGAKPVDYSCSAHRVSRKR